MADATPARASARERSLFACDQAASLPLELPIGGAVALATIASVIAVVVGVLAYLSARGLA